MESYFKGSLKVDLLWCGEQLRHWLDPSCSPEGREMSHLLGKAQHQGPGTSHAVETFDRSPCHGDLRTRRLNHARKKVAQHLHSKAEAPVRHHPKLLSNSFQTPFKVTFQV